MAVTAPIETMTPPNGGVFFEPELPVPALVAVPDFDPDAVPVAEVVEPAEVQSILYGRRYELADTLGSLVRYMDFDAQLGNMQSGLADADRAAAIGAHRYDKRQGFLQTGSSFLGNIALDIGPDRQVEIDRRLYETQHGGLLTVAPVGEPRTAFGSFEPTDKDVKEGVGRADDDDWLALLINMKIMSEKPFNHRQENFGVINRLWKMY